MASNRPRQAQCHDQFRRDLGGWCLVLGFCTGEYPYPLPLTPYPLPLTLTLRVVDSWGRTEIHCLHRALCGRWVLPHRGKPSALVYWTVRAEIQHWFQIRLQRICSKFAILRSTQGYFQHSEGMLRQYFQLRQTSRRRPSYEAATLDARQDWSRREGKSHQLIDCQKRSHWCR